MIACAPQEERCGLRATHWQSNVSWLPVRLCACCYSYYSRNGMSYRFHPTPTERVALLGCAAMVSK